MPETTARQHFAKVLDYIRARKALFALDRDSRSDRELAAHDARMHEIRLVEKEILREPEAEEGYDRAAILGETDWDALLAQAYNQARETAAGVAFRNPDLTSRDLRAFKYGFETGWRQAIAAARKRGRE